MCTVITYVPVAVQATYWNLISQTKILTLAVHVPRINMLAILVVSQLTGFILPSQAYNCTFHSVNYFG